MKMMRFLLLIGLILTSNLIYGQHPTVTVVPDFHKRFKVGDMYYASSYKGLLLYMNDLESDNPDLYSKLTPAFNDIESKRHKALVSVVSAGIIGTTLCVGGYTFLQKDNDFFKPGDAFYDLNSKKPNQAVIGAGLGVYLIGGIIGLIVSPQEADIYRFINLNNKYNPDNKMDWEIGMDFNQNKEVGLKLTMKF